MKRTHLHIGELAQLLGITQKAIRHYQKIGLLREPQRSEGGYRLYDARDLVRLQRIRRLQGLGLSLKQIKMVLGDASHEHDVSHEQMLRNVLVALDEQLSTQIQVLERRRGRVQELLAKEMKETKEILESMTTTPDDSPNLQVIKGYLTQQHIEISPELMAQEAQVYAYLEDFHWSDGHEQAIQDTMTQLLQYMSEHPEEYQQLLALGERLVTIASLSPGHPQVEQLAQDFRHYFTMYPFLFKLGKDASEMSTPFNAVFSELFMSGYTSAQQRVFEEIKQLIEERKT